MQKRQTAQAVVRESAELRGQVESCATLTRRGLSNHRHGYGDLVEKDPGLGAYDAVGDEALFPLECAAVGDYTDFRLEQFHELTGGGTPESGPAGRAVGFDWLEGGNQGGRRGAAHDGGDGRAEGVHVEAGVGLAAGG